MPRYDDRPANPEADRPDGPTLGTFAAALALALLYVGLLALVEPPGSGFELRSPDFAPGEPMPDRLALSDYGCAGENRSPALVWRGSPPGTASFAVTLHDPDAPNAGGWWHWIVIDIPGDRTGLPAASPGAKPADWPAEAREWRTDFGVPGYGGPCPPQGALHRYVLTLHAFAGETPEPPPGLPAAALGRWLRVNALATAELKGLYSRP